MLRFTILASGSSGNCSYLETDKGRYLIDAGISAKQIELRLEKIGARLDQVNGVFVTHEHDDHVCGLPVLSRKYQFPIYSNRLTADQVRPKMREFTGWHYFETGSSLLIGEMQVETFSVPHDAYDPVGFLFHLKEGTIGFLTDLGYATKLVVERVRQARALVLESNYDLQKLQDDKKRPWSVKQRILSRHGHLSNIAAAELAVEIATERLEDLFLGHLSSDCNSPELAEEVMRSKLTESGIHHIRVHRAHPDQPSTTLCWD